jgi:hypothetical protein
MDIAFEMSSEWKVYLDSLSEAYLFFGSHSCEAASGPISVGNGTAYA